MSLKLEWKKKWTDDKSGCWYSAKVPAINWEYIVETTYKDDVVCGIYYNKTDDDITKFSKKKFKNKQQAMNACEKHLQETYKKFKSWIQTVTYES